MLPLTQDEFFDIYITLVESADPEEDITDYADFNTKGKVLSGIVAAQAEDAYNNFKNLYPQLSDDQGVNLILSAAGVPITYPATQAILTLEGDDLVVDQTYNVPLNTRVTAPDGSTYKVITSSNSNFTEVIVSTINPTLFVVSTALGQNTAQPVTTVLTITPPIVSVDGTQTLSSCTVTAFTDGSNQETLTNATDRSVKIKQVPLCDTRSTDFAYLARDPANSVTDVVTLINNQLKYTNREWNIGIYDVSASPINNTILNKGLLPATTTEVFSRTSSTESIDYTQEVMNQQDIVGAHPIVNTVETQQITSLTGSPNPFFRISVGLQFGYLLSTQVTLEDGTFTVLQLIQREVRRAICAQPYGASLVRTTSNSAYTSSSLPISSIEQQLDLALGTASTTGIIGSYLKDRLVLVWNGSEYVYMSSLPLDLGIPIANTDKLQWIYDISTTAAYIYPNISVNLL